MITAWGNTSEFGTLLYDVSLTWISFVVSLRLMSHRHWGVLG